MELTVPEQRALSTLVKRQRQWRWYRFVMLLVGFAIIAVAIWLGLRLRGELLDTTRRMSFNESPTGAEVFFASQYGGLIAVVDLLPVLGGLVIGMALGKWRGNPVDQLVIGLASRAANSVEKAGSTL